MRHVDTGDDTARLTRKRGYFLTGAAIAWRRRGEPLGKFALAALLLYPVADIFSAAGNANVLRTFCGSWSLDLLAVLAIAALAIRPAWMTAVVTACLANAAVHAYPVGATRQPVFRSRR